MGSVFVFRRGFCPKNIDDLQGGPMAQCPPLNTLVIRKFNLNLNYLLYASGSIFLLNIFESNMKNHLL